MVTKRILFVSGGVFLLLIICIGFYCIAHKSCNNNSDHLDFTPAAIRECEHLLKSWPYDKLKHGELVQTSLISAINDLKTGVYRDGRPRLIFAIFEPNRAVLKFSWIQSEDVSVQLWLTNSQKLVQRKVKLFRDDEDMHAVFGGYPVRLSVRPCIKDSGISDNNSVDRNGFSHFIIPDGEIEIWLEDVKGRQSNHLFVLEPNYWPKISFGMPSQVTETTKK
jgi:hypothetical protein